MKSKLELELEIALKKLELKQLEIDLLRSEDVPFNKEEAASDWKDIDKKIAEFQKGYAKTIKQVQSYVGERYPEDLKIALAKLVSDGVPMSEVAKKTKIHYTLVRVWSKKYA